MGQKENCQDELKTYFSEWKGLSIVCPKWTIEKPDFDITGDPSQMITDMMVFNIKKCADDPDGHDHDNGSKSTAKCPAPQVVDAWIKNIAVEAWTI